MLEFDKVWRHRIKTIWLEIYISEKLITPPKEDEETSYKGIKDKAINVWQKTGKKPIILQLKIHTKNNVHSNRAR